MRTDRLLVGRIVKPHGIRGEVSVEVYSDAPDRFAPGAVLGAGDPPEPVTVAASRPHQGRMLIRFEEAPDRDAAEGMRGLVLSIPVEEAEPLAPGAYYPHQLEGLAVADADGTDLGVWARALSSPAHDVWVVRTETGDVMVPAVREVVVEVDLDARRIVLAPPPGLFDR